VQFIADVLDPSDYLVNQLPVIFQLLLFSGGHLHSNDELLKDVVVGVMLVGLPFPVLELLFEFEIHPECLGVDLMQIGKEVFA
jgi:hypothetical protein